ncbi:MAG: hypothetical protein WB392_13710 [Methanotrichaceae archaeon]
MNRLNILCILILLSVCSAEDTMFFADDHYKAIGGPKLSASAASPVLYPGDNSTLVILLGNIGRMDELIPTQRNGSYDDIMKEMRDEMRSVDALNITASLQSSGPVDVVSEPCVVTSLPTGSIVRMMFNISAAGADGWYELPLTLDYEHQVDVMVENGVVTPLYQTDSNIILIKVFIDGQDSISVVGVKSDLHPGGIGTILAAIKNNRDEILSNCTARLMASPRFVSEDSVHLGSIASGQIAVAEFAVTADGNVSASDYNLPCELDYDGGSSLLQIPVRIGTTPNPLIYILIAVSVVLVVVAIGVSWRKRLHRSKWRKFLR